MSSKIYSLFHQNIPKFATILGNNEGNGNYNYSLTSNDPYYKLLYENCSLNKMINNDNFLKFGYYSNVYTDLKLKIIALNTNYWSY